MKTAEEHIKTLRIRLKLLEDTLLPQARRDKHDCLDMWEDEREALIWVLAHSTQGEIEEAVDAVVAERDALRNAITRWSEAREDWTFSARCTLDEAGDELQAVLKGQPAPAKGERAAAIVEALASAADERVARPCPTCGKPGCRPQEHAGWDPSKDMP